MKTGMVILNYNDYENTIKMILQVRDYKNINKIVVVDNHSTDSSVEKITPYLNKHVVLVEARKNGGYAFGNNLGLKYLEKNTDCELAIISNPDVLVSESVITELIHDMKKDESISFLGPKIIERGHITKGWKLPSLWCEALSCINYFNRYSFNMQKYPDDYYNEKIVKVEVLHGCFFMARLKDFKKIKYFDPHTFLYYEENIIAKKAYVYDLKTCVDTSLSVTHLASQTVSKNLNKVRKYKALKKSMFYYEKEYNHLNILGMIFLKLLYYISLGIAYLTFWI